MESTKTPSTNLWTYLQISGFIPLSRPLIVSRCLVKQLMYSFVSHEPDVFSPKLYKSANKGSQYINSTNLTNSTVSIGTCCDIDWDMLWCHTWSPRPGNFISTTSFVLPAELKSKYRSLEPFNIVVVTEFVYVTIKVHLTTLFILLVIVISQVTKSKILEYHRSDKHWKK